MLVKHYLQLAKIRVTAMVLVTTAVGYLLGSSGPIHWSGFWLTLLGTGLAVVGASALNQLLEIDRDAKMRRTRNRPLPAGAISRTRAFLFAMIATAAGLGVLNEFVNPLTSLLGLDERIALRLGLYAAEAEDVAEHAGRRGLRGLAAGDGLDGGRRRPVD